MDRILERLILPVVALRLQVSRGRLADPGADEAGGRGSALWIGCGESVAQLISGKFPGWLRRHHLSGAGGEMPSSSTSIACRLGQGSRCRRI